MLGECDKERGSTKSSGAAACVFGHDWRGMFSGFDRTAYGLFCVFFCYFFLLLFFDWVLRFSKCCFSIYVLFFVVAFCGDVSGVFCL